MMEEKSLRIAGGISPKISCSSYVSRVLYNAPAAARQHAVSVVWTKRRSKLEYIVGGAEY